MSNTPVSDATLQARAEAVVREASKSLTIRPRLVKIANACDKLGG